MFQLRINRPRWPPLPTGRPLPHHPRVRLNPPIQPLPMVQHLPRRRYLQVLVLDYPMGTWFRPRRLVHTFRQISSLPSTLPVLDQERILPHSLARPHEIVLQQQRNHTPSQPLLWPTRHWIWPLDLGQSSTRSLSMLFSQKSIVILSRSLVRA